MRRIYLIFLLVATVSLAAQNPSATPTPAPPQSARQALIEMFMGKGEHDFQKHLPDMAHQALIHKGETPETSVILRISTFGRQMVAQGEHVETFDTGPTIMTFDENGGHEKIEVLVEHDSLLGEDDEIELSIHYYKEGQQQSLPVVPRLVFTFRQEKEIWKLTEVTAAAHVPLTDPDYLKGLRQQQDEANEAAAQNHVNIIVNAESGYTTKHPDRGYTCTLTNLFATDPTAAGAEEMPYYGAGFASDESGGYHFALTGCEGSPASKYRVTAVPTDPDSGLKTFCADESGTLRFVTGGKSSSCFSRGQPVNSGATNTVTVD